MEERDPTEEDLALAAARQAVATAAELAAATAAASVVNPAAAKRDLTPDLTPTRRFAEPARDLALTLAEATLQEEPTSCNAEVSLPRSR